MVSLRVTPPSSMQAISEADKREDGVPTVFHRRDREGWLVTMRLDDWMDLFGAWRE